MRARWALGVAALLAAWAVPAGVVLAGKPSSGGGGGGGPTGGGTIFFWSGTSRLWSMNSDGSAKSQLAVATDMLPSRLLHGGHRWYLQTREIAGELYPQGQDGISGTRREVFAVRDDDASAVQLTTQADLEHDYGPEWIPGDVGVSWKARRWAGGAVAEGGIYTAALIFDGAGNVIGLDAQPLSPSIELPLVLWNTSPSNYPFGGDLGPDVYTHDWSPDGTQIVYDRFTANDAVIAVVSGGRRQLVGALARDPVWSPDGSRVAYTSDRGIDMITPAGTGATTLVKSGRSYDVSSPIWSPTGSHVVLQRLDRSLEQYVCRVAANGGSTTNLTPETTHAAPVAWR